MPAKKRCQAHLIVSSPPLPATSHSTNPNPLPANLNPSSPTALAANKPLPATDASRDTLSCNKPAQRIVGDCGFCQGSFCADHRLPEQHGCSKLQACRDAAHAANKAKLESERTVARKISMA